MTERFIVQPSKMILRWLMAVHVIAAIVVTLFSISLGFRLGLIVLLVISAGWQFKQWKSNKRILEFNSVDQRWLLTRHGNKWHEMVKVQPVYITSKCIWLNFFGQQGSLVTVLVGADTMNEAKYLQLRRSVICPAVLVGSSS